jgi:hypothetical protein
MEKKKVTIQKKLMEESNIISTRMTGPMVTELTHCMMEQYIVVKLKTAAFMAMDSLSIEITMNMTVN